MGVLGNARLEAAWYTYIVRVIVPDCTVMIPLLEDEGFAEAYIVNEALFAPFDADTVSQLVELLLTVHVELDVTFTESVVYADVGYHDEDESDSVGDDPDCVTLTVLLIEPVPVVVTVIVPVLDKLEVFVETYIMNDPLFVPLDADKVSQLAELLLTVHDALDVTLIVVDVLALEGLHEADDNVR